VTLVKANTIRSQEYQNCLIGYGKQSSIHSSKHYKFKERRKHLSKSTVIIFVYPRVFFPSFHAQIRGKEKVSVPIVKTMPIMGVQEEKETNKKAHTHKMPHVSRLYHKKRRSHKT
jgi:hypothetical protein